MEHEFKAFCVCVQNFNNIIIIKLEKSQPCKNLFKVAY